MCCGLVPASRKRYRRLEQGGEPCPVGPIEFVFAMPAQAPTNTNFASRSPQACHRNSAAGQIRPLASVEVVAVCVIPPGLQRRVEHELRDNLRESKRRGFVLMAA